MSAAAADTAGRTFGGRAVTAVTAERAEVAADIALVGLIDPCPAVEAHALASTTAAASMSDVVALPATAPTLRA